MEQYLGVEIGGTKQQVAVGTEDGEIIEKKTVKLQMTHGASDILVWLETTIKELLLTHEIKKISVGFGGPLNSLSGKALCSIQVRGWNDFSITGWFRDTFQIDTIVLNDTVAGGLAESCKGAGRGSPCFFYTNIGTGIGGGLFIHNKYYDGSGQGAFYFGNTWVPDWTVSVPGKAIRLERICSGKGIEERLNTSGYIPDGSILKTRYGRITSFDLEKGVRSGDAFCISELDKTAETFGIGLANVLASSGVDTIAIGGGVAKMGDILFDRIRKYTAQYEFIANAGCYKIVPSVFMDDAVLAGALLAVKHLQYLN